MSSQGPLFPSSGTDDASIGTLVWSNPGNITADDGVVANSGTTSGSSHYLVGKNFGFSIPAGATINGILVEWKKAAQFNGTYAADNAIRIVKGGTIGTTDKSIAGDWGTTVLTYFSYGSSSELWGLTWASTDINATGFGAALSAQSGSGGVDIAQVDCVRITVYYTAAAAGLAAKSVLVNQAVNRASSY